MIEQKENESKKEYLKRLFDKADKHCNNIEGIFKEMKEKGITICGECGCSIYPDKKHEC